MEAFLKTLPILFLLTSKSTLNAKLQRTSINTDPSTPPLPPPPPTLGERPNIFASPSSLDPSIGVNGRGIFTGTALASEGGPSVKLHSYPWLTLNKLLNSNDPSGRKLLFDEDTSFHVPSETFGSSPQTITRIPNIPNIPNPPTLPNLPTFPAPVKSRRTRSIITPQFVQAQVSPNVQTAGAIPANAQIASGFPPNFQFANAFPTHFQPQFPIYPFSYPIPYTIVTQVIPVWPTFGVFPQPVMPVVSAEASGAVIMKAPTTTPKPEIITEGEFSGATEIQGPYPEPAKPDTEAKAEIQGPYPDIVPEVNGEAIGEAMLSPYPAALPETSGDSSGDVDLAGPYPAPAPPVVSGEASGGAAIEGPYPSAIKPEVSSEGKGPYPAPVKPVVSGEASGGAKIEGPYPSTTKSGNISKFRAPIPAPAKPIVRVVANGVASQQKPLPVTVKPPSQEPKEMMNEFVVELEKPAKMVSGEGTKRKGPYLIPKKPVVDDDLDALLSPSVPLARRDHRSSYAARLREVVYPEYVRNAAGRIVRFN